MKLFRIALILPSFKSGTSDVLTSLPSGSRVSVEIPSNRSNRYSLSMCKNWLESFVALPMRMIMSPEANGSSAPAWPTFLVSNLFLTWSTRSCDVMPVGLFRASMPFGLPYLSFVTLLNLNFVYNMVRDTYLRLGMSRFNQFRSNSSTVVDKVVELSVFVRLLSLREIRRDYAGIDPSSLRCTQLRRDKSVLV